MATTKAASTKRATAKKPAAAKTTVRTVRTSANTERTASVSAARVKANALPNNIVNIVFAELVGTFVLTLVALLAFKETSALYVGLTLSLLVVAIGAVSGHIRSLDYAKAQNRACAILLGCSVPRCNACCHRDKLAGKWRGQTQL